MKKALITGIAGQDGSYLAEFLLGKGYEVHGLDSRNPKVNKEVFWRLERILNKIVFHEGDVGNLENTRELVREILPDEVYHLAAKHDLPNSVENYREIMATNFDSTYFFLSAIKELSPSTKFFFASSSRVFGNPVVSPQNEEIKTSPNSLYGISKAAASELVEMYRKEGIFACTGILYNHESPRRDPEFLPRKISMAVAEIKRGNLNKLKLGDLDARRDWSFADDFVEAMWLMLQAEHPEDYVLGSGETHSVKEFLEIAFGHIELDWKAHIETDSSLVRIKEREIRADITKIKKTLGWEPKVKFKELVEMMVDADMNLIK